MKIKREKFGTTKQGEPVELFTLENAAGMMVGIINYGATVVSMQVPDNMGVPDEVVLGFDNLEQYETNNAHIGAVIGRYANRIAGGSFSIGGENFQLSQNQGANTLHGGKIGFDKKVWAASPFETETACGVSLRYTSPAGEEGFPGKLEVEATYTLGLSK